MPVEGPMIDEPQGEVARHLEESERELIGELVANFHNYEDDWRAAGRLWQVEELVQCTWTTFQNSTAYPAEMKLMLSYAISHYNLTLDMADPHDATIHHGLEGALQHGQQPLGAGMDHGSPADGKTDTENWTG